jgi:hypothetical protein
VLGEENDPRVNGIVIWVEHSVFLLPVGDLLPPSLGALATTVTDTESLEELEEPVEDQQEPQVSITPERLDKPLKFRLPRSERLDVMRIVSRLSDQLQTSVEWSHVGRALVVLLRHAESEIIKQARRNGPLTRPPNDQAIALAEFEQRIAQIVLRAFRDVSPLR